MKLSLFRGSGRRLPPAWVAFLKLYVCFAIVTSFSGTFINTYLIRATGGSDGVMRFNIVLAGVQPFAMLIAVWLMRKKSPLFTQSIGMALYALAFLVLTVLGESAVPYITWVSAALSAANGFFYTTFALQLLAYSDDENRDACFGMQNVITNAIGIVLPLLVGILLASFENFTGYRILFVIGFLISALGVIVNGRLQPITGLSEHAQIGRALKVLLTKKPARAAMLASAANGFYSGTMTFFVNILVYAIVKNETVIGAMTTTSSIIAIVSSMAYTRIVRPQNRLKSILISLGIMMCAACVLLFKVNLFTLIAFNLLLSALVAFFLNPATTAYFSVAGSLPELKGLGSEVHALREFWYGGGRVLGILMTMALSSLSNGVGLVILIILAVQLIPAALMKQMKVSDE